MSATSTLFSIRLLPLGATLALLLGAPASSALAREPGVAPPLLDAASVAMAPTLDGKININTASGAELQMLPGVGPATAAKILAYRIRRKFGHPTHLMRVKGIGRKTYTAIRRYITVEGETTLSVPAAASG